MKQGRYGIKSIGLALVAALSILAVTAVAAQAAEYRLNGTEFKTVPLTEESVTGPVGPGKLLVPGLLTIECTSGDVLSASVIQGGTAKAKILFLGCKVEGNKFCIVYPTKKDQEAKTNAGDLTAGGIGKLVLMGTAPVKHYLLIEEEEVAKVKVPFTTVFFTVGGGCTLNSGETVTGSGVAELPDALTSQPEHLLVPLTEAQIKELFPTDLLKYGNQSAWIDGTDAKVKLSGPNAGKNWSAE